MLTQTLTHTIVSSWKYSESLGKLKFCIDALPKSIEVLAATDDSMIINIKGHGKYFVIRDQLANVTVIERY